MLSSDEVSFVRQYQEGFIFLEMAWPCIAKDYPHGVGTLKELQKKHLVSIRLQPAKIKQQNVTRPPRMRIVGSEIIPCLLELLDITKELGDDYEDFELPAWQQSCGGDPHRSQPFLAC